MRKGLFKRLPRAQGEKRGQGACTRGNWLSHTAPEPPGSETHSWVPGSTGQSFRRERVPLGLSAENPSVGTLTQLRCFGNMEGNRNSISSLTFCKEICDQTFSTNMWPDNSTFKTWRSWHPVPSLPGKKMGKQWKNCDRLYFLGLQNHCRWWLHPWNEKTLAPWKKSYDQPRQHVKSRDITLPTKVYLVKAMVFPVVMYGCESWTIKKADYQRIDALELWCWKRLLRVPWTARSNQSILKEISPESSLEGLMPKLQNFGHLMRRIDSLEKTWCRERWKAGGEGDNRGWDGWMASLTQRTWVWANSGSWWWTGKPGMLQSKGLQRVSHNWANELNWTDVTRNWILSKTRPVPSLWSSGWYWADPRVCVSCGKR